MRGIIKVIKGKFGFVLGYDKKEFFFHKDDVITEKKLRAYDVVEYELEETKKGLRAVKVRHADIEANKELSKEEDNEPDEESEKEEE